MLRTFGKWRPKWFVTASARTVLAGLALVSFAPLASAQMVITGRVTDDQGVPVAAAEVSIDAIRLLVPTANDGTYRLLVPAARARGQRVTIKATALGYRTATASIVLTGELLEQDFVIGIDPLGIEAVVAIGQTLQRERVRVASTVDDVQATEIRASGEQNIVSALAGKAPNVEVTSSAGDPISGTYIRIRGSNTLAGSNQPLIVIDGTPVNNSSIEIESDVWGTPIQNRAVDFNPDDVERIDILKGPAASAIYGAAGANGAVLITTKSGKKGQTRAELSMSYSFDEVTQTQPLQTTYGQGSGGVASASSTSWGPRLDPSTTVYDHTKEVFQTGNRFDSNLSLSGGSERTTYYLSLGYLNHQGSLRGPAEYERAALRLKGTHDFRDNLTVGANVAYTNGSGDAIQQGSNLSGVLLGALRTPPEFNNLPYIDPETGLHRSYRCATGNRGPDCPVTLAASRGYDNPFFVMNEIPNTTEVDRVFGNVNLDWQPLNWLNVAATLGADYSGDARHTLFPKSTSEFPDGRLIRADLTTFDVDWTMLLTGRYDFNENISGSLTVGQNLRQEEFKRYQVDGDIVVFGTDQLDFAVDRSPNEYREKVRTAGYFTSATLDLWNQLFLSGGFRNDGSSTFGGEERFFFYPNFGAAWAFTELPAFQEGLDWLNFGKLRFAWGEAGKTPPVFSNLTGFVSGTITDGWLSPQGLETIYLGNSGYVRSATAANELIKPEKTREYEVGLDLAFLDNRIGFSGVYYNARTTDAILNLQVPISTGFFSQPQNAGAWDNWGWELSLDLGLVRESNFSWDVSAQWAKNDSEVKTLATAEEFGLAGFTGSAVSVVADQCGPRADEACPFMVIFGDDWVRFGRGESFAGENIDEVYSGWQPGDLFITSSGFPVLSPREWVIGDPNPNWTASVRSTFTFMQNFRLSGLFDFKNGGDMWNGTRGALTHFGTHATTEAWHGDGIEHVFESCSGCGPGAGQTVTLNEAWGTGQGGGFNGPSSQFVEDAGFVKLRDVSLTYTANQEWVKRLGMAAIEFTVSGRNLKTWTDYTGIDPESNLVGQDTGRGLEYFNHPQTRSWIVTVNFIR